MPPDVSLPMPMHAHTWSLHEQFEICTSSVGRAIVFPSTPRPDFSEMQSSVVSKSQPSMVTFLHESTSIPSAPLFTTTFLNVTFSQYSGWIDHIPVCSV